uniref:Uncharacterized protein n=1 Tax=Plectus sambesii TaxID=2011161 RepID=A0A914WPC4_9BILA
MLIALRWFAISVVLFANGVVCAKSIQKRQSAIDDLVTKALSIVQPIFNVNVDKHQLLQSDTMIPLGKLDALNPLVSERDKQILGAQKYDSLDDVPICKGNSRICKFISCTAENFKSDESFDDLNLAVQVLGDREMRQTISSDPDVMDVVCSERHLSASQCKLFTNGFQLIDKFMTTIEDLDVKERRKIVIDHSHDTGPTTARQIDAHRPSSSHSHRKPPQSNSLTNVRHDGRVVAETRRSPPRIPTRHHPSRSQLHNVPQPAWWSDAQSTHRRTIFTTNVNHERTLNRDKREDDYYDQVEKMENRRGGHRGERRRHPLSALTSRSSSRHQKIGGRHAGSAAISSATDGKTDYYSVSAGRSLALGQISFSAQRLRRSTAPSSGAARRRHPPIGLIFRPSAGGDAMSQIFPLIPVTFAILFYNVLSLPQGRDSDEAAPLKENQSDMLKGLLGDKGLLTRLMEALSEKVPAQLNLTIPSPPTSAYQHDDELQAELLSSADEREKQSQLDTTGWTKILFGQNGVLKKVVDNVDAKDATPVRKELDFGRIFNGLLENAREKKYGEPLIPEIPDIGICDRLSCGDIYKAVDEFRTSEFFSNFQTAIQLMQDPEGWQLISDVITNPELLSTLTNPEEEVVEVAEKSLKPSAKILPETSFSIDGGSDDYYSQVDTGNVDYHVSEITQKPPPPPPPSKTNTSSESLPDISLSIDDGADGTDYLESVDSGTHVEETIEIPKETVVDAKPAVISTGQGESRQKSPATKKTTAAVKTTTATIAP